MLIGNLALELRTLPISTTLKHLEVHIKLFYRIVSYHYTNSVVHRCCFQFTSWSTTYLQDMMAPISFHCFLTLLLRQAKNYTRFLLPFKVSLLRSLAGQRHSSSSSSPLTAFISAGTDRSRQLNEALSQPQPASSTTSSKPWSP